MSSNQSQYQSEFLTDFFKDDEDAKSGFMPVAKSGFVRCILLFGSAILALALVIVPVLSEKANKQTAQSLFPAGVDMMSTGSVQRDPADKSYIERKSLLQSTPQSVCLIARDGTQHGDC
ncbi:MAG: hypothetical protein LBI75_07710 [Brucellaceae bacterium]|nr:hypothetical protein [Brucellaceae bacterium]